MRVRTQSWDTSKSNIDNMYLAQKPQIEGHGMKTMIDRS